MDAFAKLPHEIDHLINSLKSQTMVGTDTIGITQYSVWFAIALVVLLVVVFSAVKRLELVPKGRFVNAVEYLFEFVQNDIVDNVIGPGGRRHLPFIMTLFFFILINNMLGLIPGGKPGTGTFGVTFALALVSFIYFLACGIKTHGVIGYLKSLAPPGVFFPINILIWVIEIFSTLIRLATLAIRLFCNMFAGHIILGAFAILTSLFIGPLFQQITASNLVGALPSIAWMALLIFIYTVEMMVSVIQAYVFTVLTAVYIQLAEAQEH